MSILEDRLPKTCWLWTAATTNGYGVCGRNQKAHRVAYELLVGPIPDGLVLDHLCRNRACVNPAHLEAVTNAENIRRGQARRGGNNGLGLREECANGHPFTPENTYWRADGARRCRTCNRESAARTQRVRIERRDRLIEVGKTEQVAA